MQKSFKQIKLQLQEILNKLHWKNESIAEINQTLYKLSGLINIRSLINELEELELFMPIVNTLKKSILFTSSNDVMSIQHSEGVLISSNLTLLKTLIQNF